MVDVDRLIQQWQAGDEGAAEALYDHYQRSLFHLAYGLLGDPADAEEVAQDALAYALTNIHHYQPQRASFKTWLHTITVSRCRDRQRRKRLPKLSLSTWPGEDGDVADPSPNPERRTAANETYDQVWQAVQELSRPLKEAIVLRYWAGHTYREIADILDCPVPTVQSRVRLAFDKLKGALCQVHLL